MASRLVWRRLGSTRATAAVAARTAAMAPRNSLLRLRENASCRPCHIPQSAMSRGVSGSGRRVCIRSINCDGLRKMLRRMGLIQGEGEWSAVEVRFAAEAKRLKRQGMDAATVEAVLGEEMEEAVRRESLLPPSGRAAYHARKLKKVRGDFLGCVGPLS